MLTLRAEDVRLRRCVRFLHPRIPLYIVPRGEGLYMIGATMIESGETGGVSVRSAIELLSAAYALHPAFGEAEIVEMRAGLRPAFPDNEPRIVERDGAHFRQRLLPPRLPARARPSPSARRRSSAYRKSGGARYEAGRERGAAARSRRRRSRAALEALDYGEAKVATALNGDFVPARSARDDAGQGRRPDRDSRAAAGGLNDGEISWS